MENQTEIKETTKFGLGQVGNHTPQWATWVFRITLYLLSFVMLALSTLNVSRFGLTDLDIKDLTALFSLLIIGIHTLTRMVGVDIKNEDYQIK